MPILFAFLAVILFVIVRKNRRKQHAMEAERHQKIDDGVELDFNLASAGIVQGGGYAARPQSPPEDVEHHAFEAPPKY